MGLTNTILGLVAEDLEARIDGGQLCRHMGTGAYRRVRQLSRLVDERAVSEHAALAEAKRTLEAVRPFSCLPEPRPWSGSTAT